MARGKLDGVALAAAAAGGVFIYAGIKGYSIPATIQDLVTGKSPAGQQQTAPVTAPAAAAGSSGGAGSIGGTPPSTASVAAYKAYAQVLLAAHGWAGQMGSLTAIIGEEDSSWSPTARNPSGAYGIAQALGHGQGTATAGSNGINEYGNYGTPAAVCQLANEGHGEAQLEWMCNYIAQVYGDPDKAQAFHLANGYY